jgi:hypothetical protein
MITKRFLYPFISGRKCLCPFCKVPLVLHPSHENHKIKYCAHCPYFFEIKAFGQDKAYNAMEVTLNQIPCRVWIANWRKIQVHKIGEHRHITCVFLPIKDANFDDMDKFINRIKTILTFQ